MKTKSLLALLLASTLSFGSGFFGSGGAGAGDVDGPSSSTNGTIALFNGITGKAIKEATGTGVCKATSGVFSTGLVDLLTEVTGAGTIATQNSNNVSITGGSITGMPTPSAASDVAIKSYVDAVATALTYKGSVRYATAAALTATYVNGTSGVGATLTNAGSLAAFSVDGSSPSSGDRILIKNQASGLQNGCYTVTTVGSGIIAWVLTRCTDYDQASEIAEGNSFYVAEGSTLLETAWVMTTSGAITVGTTALSFAQTIAASQTVTLAGDTSGTGQTGTSITTTIGANKVLDTMIRQGAARSVIGNATSSTANVADITAGTDANILRRSGTGIGFGAIDLAAIGAVGTTKLGAANGGIGVDSSGSTGYAYDTAGTYSFKSASTVAGELDHNLLTNLTTGDVHTQYGLLAGRSGGQTFTGGTAASNNLVLRSTTNGTKGQTYVDETTAATSPTTGALRVGGGVGVAGTLWAAGLLRSETSFVLEDPGAGTNKYTFTSPTLAADRTIVWPAAAPTANQILYSTDTAGTLGWKDETATLQQGYDLKNCSLAVTKSSNAMTIALKNTSGSDPSVGSPCTVSLRNKTASTGTYSIATISAALSFIASSGSTLGTSNAVADNIYVYLIDSASAGTYFMAAVTNPSIKWEDISNATDEGGAGAADTRGTLYVDHTAAGNLTARSVALLGIVNNTETTAGTWTSTPNTIQSYPNLPAGGGVPKFGASNSPKLGSATLNCDASASITNNPDSMISTIGNQSGASCAVTFATGYFSSAVYECSALVEGASSRFIRSAITSGTAWSIGCTDSANANATCDLQINCRGEP